MPVEQRWDHCASAPARHIVPRKGAQGASWWRLDQVSSGAPHADFSNSARSFCACASAEGVGCCCGPVTEGVCISSVEILMGEMGGGAYFEWKMRSNPVEADLIKEVWTAGMRRMRRQMASSANAFLPKSPKRGRIS